jgi:hypothetical protein
MGMRTRHIVLASVLVLAATWTADSSAAGDCDGQSVIISAVSIERQGCFSPCPVYRLTVHADGTVVYEGLMHVNETGQRVGRATPDDVERLFDAVRGIDFFALDERYSFGAPGCPQAVTCDTTVVTSVEAHGCKKTVSHYHGCKGSPKLAELSALERLIDETANSVQWTGPWPK